MSEMTGITGIIYADKLTSWRKNGEDRSRTFWANRTRRSSTDRKQFWLCRITRGHYGWYHSTEEKFPIFSVGGMCLSLVILELRRKKRNSRKWKLVAVATYRPLKIRKSGFRSFMYCHSGTERWKPRENRPVEAEIIGLTVSLIVKQRKKYATSVIQYNTIQNL